MRSKISLLFVVLLLIQPAFALKLRENFPHRYVVKEGDTLWGIADKFLLEPWEWEQLVKTNPKLNDPTKLYPGMVIDIRRIDGKPILTLSRGYTVKLSPKVRRLEVQHPIPPIHFKQIGHFLLPSIVLNKREIEAVPHIVDFHNENIVGGPPFIAYTSDLMDGKTGDLYSIYRPTEKYYDKDAREVIGYAAEYVGQATLLHPGSPASFKIKKSILEVRVGDKVIKSPPIDFPPYFIPRPPPKKIDGRVVALHNEYGMSGRHQIIAINRGKKDGVKPGYVFALYEPKRYKEDKIDPRQKYMIPEERIGEILVFNVFERASLALIMKSTEEVRRDDLIHNP